MLSSDLDIIIATLLLLLRPSQQYSGQPGLGQTLNVSTIRLEAFIKAWPSLREHGIEMVDLVDDKSDERLEKLAQDASEVNFSFYTTGEDEKNAMNVEGSGKTKSSAPYEVRLGPLARSSRSAGEVFADAVAAHNVPDKERGELMCRIRTSLALGPGRREDRQKLVMVRLLAIGIYAHTHTESQAQNSILMNDPDLFNRIAEVLQLDRGITPMVQMTALSALDGLARYRNKAQEVLAAVNASVNHGILMSLFRKTVADVSVAGSTLPTIFVDALLSFIGLVAQYPSGGSQIVGAGLMPLIIQIIGITLPERVSFVSRTLTIVDHALFNYSNAFTLFCNGRGIDALTDRIKV